MIRWATTKSRFQQPAPEEGGGIPNTLTITGITDPEGFDPLVLPTLGTIGGKRSWGDGIWAAYWNEGTHWLISKGDDFAYEARKATDTPSPVGLTGWDLTPVWGAGGAGQPTVAGS